MEYQQTSKVVHRHHEDLVFDVEILDIKLNGRDATVTTVLEILKSDFQGQRLTAVDHWDDEKNAFRYLKNCKNIGLPDTPLEAWESLEDAIGMKVSMVLKRITHTNSSRRSLFQQQHIFLPLLPEDETGFQMAS
jgi:hypothetical protein